MDLPSAKKLLSKQSKEDLIKIIVAMANSSDAAEECLLNYCEKHSAVEDKALLVKKQILHEWGMAEAVIDRANEYGGVDWNDEDDACDSLSSMQSLVKTTGIDWEFRKSLVDQMVKQFDYGNSGFEDIIIDTCEDFCQSDEEMLYLADLLKVCSSDHYRNHAASLFLKYGKEDDFVAVQSQNLRYGSDYIKLANYYKKNGQIDKAVEFVETALVKADGRMDEIYTWLFEYYDSMKLEKKIVTLYNKALKKKWNVNTITELMYRHYSGDYEKQKVYLLKMLEVCRSEDIIKWYDECKKVLKDADFANYSDKFHKIIKDRNIHAYLQLRINEGGNEEALKWFMEHPKAIGDWDVDRGHVLSKQLSKEYPAEICQIYWNQCNQLCSVSNKKNYIYAVSVLKEIRGIYKKAHLSETWKKRFAEFVENNQRKSLLMGYLRSEGLV